MSKARRVLFAWFRAVAALLLVLVAVPAFAGEELWSYDPASSPVLADRLPVPDGFATVEEPFVAVHGRAVHGLYMQRLAEHASDSLPRLADELGVPLPEKVDVFVASSAEDFRELPPSEPPAWADAVAWPGRAAIWVRAPLVRVNADAPIEVVLDHELVHVLLGRAFAPKRPPTWLQEGVAQVAAGEAGIGTSQKIARGLLGRQPIPLDELDGAFPSDPHRAQLAYAQSADFVIFVQQTYGTDALRTLIAEMRRGNNVRGAVRVATGVGFEDVERAWRARYPASYTLLFGLLSEDLVWGGIGLLAVTALLLSHRRQSRRKAAVIARLKRREREEEALRLAFAMEPPEWVAPSPSVGPH